MARDEFPVVEGLTQTEEDARPILDRLTDLLMRPSKPDTDYIDEGLKHLGMAFEVSQNAQLKARLAAAMTLIREGPGSSS
jgi:hypothetical protein